MGGSSGSGGGGSGKVSWPGYFETFHKKMLTQGIDANNTSICIERALVEAWNNSPYAGAYTSDPSGILDAIDAEVDELDAFVNALSPTGDFDTFLATAKAKLNAEAFSSSELDEVVDEYDKRQTTALMRRIGQFAAGMADVNAVNSAAFMWGVAGLMLDHQQDVARFNTQLTLQTRNQRNAMLLQAVDQMFRAQMFKTQSLADFNRIKAEFGRIRIVAEREFLDRDLELAVKDHTWNLEIWQHAGNLMASAQGGIGPTETKDQASKRGSFGSMLGGAMAGASAGAMMGLAGGPFAPISVPVGMTVGAIAGGLAGAF